MFNKQHIVRTIASTASILALSFTAACGSGQSTASNSADSNDITQQTYKPGKLTIATGQPAYEPWVMNDKPESGEGYEAAVAYAVADKLGFKKSDVVWTRTAFDTAIAPGAKDWDLNIQQFGITDERQKAVDFSSSYYNDSQSVVVKKDSKFANATKVSDLKNATVGVMVGTLAYDTPRRTSRTTSRRSMMMPHWLRHLTPVKSTHWSPAPWNACTWCSPSRSRTPRCSAVCLTPKTRAAWASCCRRIPS